MCILYILVNKTYQILHIGSKCNKIKYNLFIMKLIISILILIVIFVFLCVFNIENFDLKFVHIPKNAGTSIENSALKNNITWGFRDWSKKDNNKLIENSWKSFKKRGNWINRSTNNTYKDKKGCYPWHNTPDELGRDIYKKDDELFCVVRNPYDKIVSAYKYGYGKNASKKGLNIFIKEKISNFKKNERWNGCHLLPQHKYTQGDIKCDHILKFENLDNEFEVLMDKYNIKNIKLEKNNKSKNIISSKDLDQESKDLIYKIYKKDFELFGYKK
jgi:hypothetical protein